PAGLPGIPHGHPRLGLTPEPVLRGKEGHQLGARLHHPVPHPPCLAVEGRAVGVDGHPAPPKPVGLLLPQHLRPHPDPWLDGPRPRSPHDHRATSSRPAASSPMVGGWGLPHGTPAAFRRLHPFTAPAVSPSMNWRDMTK